MLSRSNRSAGIVVVGVVVSVGAATSAVVSCNPGNNQEVQDYPEPHHPRVFPRNSVAVSAVQQPDGGIVVETITEEGRDGLIIQMDRNSRVGRLVGQCDGVSGGLELEYWPSGGMRSIGCIVRQQRVGVWLMWNADGSIDSEASGVYDLGIKSESLPSSVSRLVMRH